MVCLRLPDGKTTTNQAEMRRHAVDFYSALFSVEEVHKGCQDELLRGLPQLSPEDRIYMDGHILLEELTTAVGQLVSGRTAYLQTFSNTFGGYWVRETVGSAAGVFRDRFTAGLLQERRSFPHPKKKGDLVLLKNWRPVALLCTDYKLLSKVFANRLKKVLDGIMGSSTGTTLTVSRTGPLWTTCF